MKLTIEVERELDGRWIAEVPRLPGVLVYGPTKDEAQARARVLTLRVVAGLIEFGETAPELTISFACWMKWSLPGSRRLLDTRSLMPVSMVTSFEASAPPKCAASVLLGDPPGSH